MSCKYDVWSIRGWSQPFPLCLCDFVPVTQSFSHHLKTPPVGLIGDRCRIYLCRQSDLPTKGEEEAGESYSILLPKMWRYLSFVFPVSKNDRWVDPPDVGNTLQIGSVTEEYGLERFWESEHRTVCVYGVSLCLKIVKPAITTVLNSFLSHLLTSKHDFV